MTDQLDLLSLLYYDIAGIKRCRRIIIQTVDPAGLSEYNRDSTSSWSDII